MSTLHPAATLTLVLAVTVALAVVLGRLTAAAKLARRERRLGYVFEYDRRPRRYFTRNQRQ